MAALDRQVRADRETVTVRLREMAQLSQQMRALAALRDELERQVRALSARADTAEAEARSAQSELTQERRLSESARAQVALLGRQLEDLRAEISRLASALDAAEAKDRDQQVQIANLGQRLNQALAQRVEDLQRYRSEFFGRLRDALGNRPGIQVVGDRFVLQSEVLFAVGSADLSPDGTESIKGLARLVLGLVHDVPTDLPWILRVDGHADRSQIRRGAAFASNWELSAARAITVVKLLIAEGVPPQRLAATGFGEFQPIDPGDSPEARARNRRIELRLTSR